MEEKYCAKCGGLYTPNRWWQKFCPGCKERHPRLKGTISIRIAQVIKCPHCTQEIDLKKLKEGIYNGD